MVALTQVHTAQIRLASYFLNKLYQINQTYISGGENVQFALKQFDSEWQQIRNWQDWSAKNHHLDSAITEFCANFTLIGKEILLVRLDLDERLSWAEMSLEASISLNNPELIAENLLILAETYNATGDSQTTIDCVSQIFDYYPESGAQLKVGKAYFIIAQAEMARGDTTAAFEFFEKSLTIFEQYHDSLYIAEVQYHLSTIAGRIGDYDAAVAYIEQALPVFERYDNIVRIGNCYNVLGLVARLRNQLDLSIQMQYKSIAYFESINYAVGLSTALANLSTSLTINEQFDEAEIVANQSLKLAQKAGSKRGIVDAYIRLGRLMISKKQFDKSSDFILEAVRVSESLDHPYALVICFQMLAYMALERNRLEDAMTYIERGLPIARSAGDNYAIAYFHLNLVDVNRKQGDIQQAKRVLYDALEPAIKAGLHTKIQIILNAVKVWQEAEEFDFAVRWTALLDKLDLLPMARTELESAHQKLVEQVSQEQFEPWFNEGSTLNLEDGLAEFKYLMEAEFE